MRRIILVLLGLAVLAVVILSINSVRERMSLNREDASSSGSSSSEASSLSSSTTLLTRNVSYEGTLDELDPALRSEGTHILKLADGTTVNLESTDVNLSLSAYLGKRVEVHGSTQPLASGNGTLMRVEEIVLLDTSSSASSNDNPTVFCGGIAALPCPEGMTCVDDPSDSCDPRNGGADCSGICQKTSSSSSSPSSSSSSSLPPPASVSAKPLEAHSSSSVQLTPPSDRISSSPKSRASSSPSSAASSIAPESASSSSSVASSLVTSEMIAQMAKQNYADGNWPEKLQYCTGHYAFCIPSQKNWYFKSFGATTTSLWHVEFAMSEITTLGQGIIVLNLVQGSSASMGVADGTIRTQGSDVVAFKDWNDNTHFELTGDASLKPAIAYMISHITSYTPGD